MPQRLHAIDVPRSHSGRWIKFVLLLAIVGACLFVFCNEADAAPGGAFVKQALSTKFGRIGGIIVGGLILLTAIILLPLILYVMYKEAAGIRQTKKDLALLAAKYKWFDWLIIRDRVNQAVRGIADVWASGDLSSAAKYMTPDYFSSQQDLLQRWTDEGKQIVYKLKKIRKIEPLAICVEDEDAYSWIRVVVTVDCVDYMRDQYTKEVVKGEVGGTNGFDSVWCFVYRDKQWLLNGIEEGSTSLTWASAKNFTDTSYLDYVRAKQRQEKAAAEEAPAKVRTRSQAAPLDPAANPPAAKKEQRLISKPTRNQDN